MYFKSLGSILFLIISIILFNKYFVKQSYYNSHKENIRNCNKLNFEELEKINNANFSKLYFQLKFLNERKWKKGLLQSHVKSYENEKISYENLKIFPVSKRFKGVIEINYKEIKCYLNAKIRAHGNFSDHRSGLDLPSLNINLSEGNIKGITKFLLLRPETRNFDNEIFNSLLFSELGFISPITFNTILNYNNKKFKVIFQEKIAKEMLERHNLRESVMTELDERFLWFDSTEAIEFSKNGVLNSNFLLKSQDNMNVGKYSVSLLNDLDRIHLNFDDDIIDYFTISDKLDLNLFDNLNVYESLIYGVLAHHSLQKDDRKFYFDSFKKNFVPIYYDGMGELLTREKKLNKHNIFENLKFLPSSISGSEEALRLIDNISLKDFQYKLSQLNFEISISDLSFVFDEIRSNLNYLKSLNESQVYRISYNKQKKILDPKNSSYNKNFNRKYVYYTDNFKNFVACDHLKINCNPIKLNDIQTAELLRGNLKIEDIYYIYLGIDIDESVGVKTFYEHQNQKFKDNFKFQFINIFMNRNIKIEIDDLNKKIQIINSNQERIVFFNSILKDWTIKYERNIESKKKNNNFVKLDEFGLTGCLTFIDSSIENLNLEITNMKCEDAVNFIRSKGNINKIHIQNSTYDSLDADFSNLQFENIYIENSSNDCLDFSYGVYKIVKTSLKYCGDKAISVGEKSNLQVEELTVKNSNIGVASKDNSKVYLNQSNIENVKYCLSAYNKKQEFWGGFINSKNITCNNFFQFIDKDNVSKIENLIVLKK